MKERRKACTIIIWLIFLLHLKNYLIALNGCMCLPTFKVLASWLIKLFCSTCTCVYPWFLQLPYMILKIHQFWLRACCFEPNTLAQLSWSRRVSHPRPWGWCKLKRLSGELRWGGFGWRKLDSVCGGSGIYIRLNSLWQFVRILILFHYLAYYKSVWLTGDKICVYYLLLNFLIKLIQFIIISCIFNEWNKMW